MLAVSVGDPEDGQRRRYPYPVVAPIVGYQSLLLGTAGLERTYDQQLVGLSDLGPGGDLLRKLRADPVDPSDLVLSVDLRLQRMAAQLLGDDRGAVVAILEPSTGRILALVTSPTYDPNRLSALATGRVVPGASCARTRTRRCSTGRPRAAYVPGSVFKLVTAIAGLETRRHPRIHALHGPAAPVAGGVRGRRLPHPRRGPRRAAGRSARPR